MKAYWGSGCIAPLILELGTRWRWVVSFTPRPLYPQGKSPWYPLDRGLGGPQSSSGRGGEEKNSHPLPGFEPWNPDRPARSPKLYRLSYHGSMGHSLCVVCWPLWHLKLVTKTTGSQVFVTVSCDTVQHLLDVKRPISYRSGMASVCRSFPSNIATHAGFRAALIKKYVTISGSLIEATGQLVHSQEHNLHLNPCVDI
jgi:hypothetical protein